MRSVQTILFFRVNGDNQILRSACRSAWSVHIRTLYVSPKDCTYLKSGDTKINAHDDWLILIIISLTPRLFLRFWKKVQHRSKSIRISVADDVVTAEISNLPTTPIHETTCDPHKQTDRQMPAATGVVTIEASAFIHIVSTRQTGRTREVNFPY